MATLLNLKNFERRKEVASGLGAILEDSLNEIYIFDVETYRLNMVNKGARQNLGYTMKELSALTPLDFQPEFTEELFTELLEPLKTSEIERLKFEALHLRKNGSTYNVEVLLQLTTYCGAPAFVAIILDVSEQKHSEDSTRLASLVYENSSQAIMITDQFDRIIDINPAFTEITGYTRAEAIRQDANFLHSDTHDQAFHDSIQCELEHTGKWQGEIWNQRKNGELYAEWQTVTTIRNEDNSLYRRVTLFSDVTKRKKTDELIWKQTNFDPLTEIPNRHLFVDRLKHEIARFDRGEEHMAILFIDLDNFKDVNDNLGHSEGDLLLKQAAVRLRSCVREGDMVARLGGDEFAILFSRMKQTACIERAIQDLLQNFSIPFKQNNETIYASISIGAAIYPADGTTCEDLMKKADQAMYYAKRTGRNRSCYYTPAMQASNQNRIQLASDLRTAISEDQFLVYYQPIVEMKTGTISKSEALIRWSHPTRGLVGPDDFIPIAEETGLIVDIGDWVFDQVAGQIQRWHTELDMDIQVSVNKSPVELGVDGKGEYCWSDSLKKQELSGTRMVVEITEGLLLDPTPLVIAQLAELRKQGLDLSLDDFGVGYSSLAYLKRFDVDYLKIDKTFVCNLAADSDDMALCEAIIVMAHKLGIKVIAEGVETQQQYDLLLAADCDYAQGYLISRPVPVTDFEQLLIEH